MGLLGGFKAKLIRKSKKEKSNAVVCVGIRNFSEFDIAENPLPSTSNARNGVIRERKLPTNPHITNIFQPSTPPVEQTVIPTVMPEEDLKPQTITIQENDNDQINLGRNFSNYNFDDDDDEDGNFKINIVQHNSNVQEESSEEEEFIPEPISPLMFSSAATSIFFGEDEEPKILRPRNIKLNEDEDSDDSCASA